MKLHHRGLGVALALVLCAFVIPNTSSAGETWAARRDEPIQLAQAGDQEQAQMQQAQQELNAAEQNLARLRAEEKQEQQQAQANGLKKRPAYATVERELHQVLGTLRSHELPTYYSGHRTMAIVRITQALAALKECEKVDRQHGCCK